MAFINMRAGSISADALSRRQLFRRGHDVAMVISSMALVLVEWFQVDRSLL